MPQSNVKIHISHLESTPIFDEIRSCDMIHESDRLQKLSHSHIKQVLFFRRIPTIAFGYHVTSHTTEDDKKTPITPQKLSLGKSINQQVTRTRMKINSLEIHIPALGSGLKNDRPNSH